MKTWSEQYEIYKKVNGIEDQEEDQEETKITFIDDLL